MASKDGIVPESRKLSCLGRPTGQDVHVCIFRSRPEATGAFVAVLIHPCPCSASFRMALSADMDVCILISWMVRGTVIIALCGKIET